MSGEVEELEIRKKDANGLMAAGRVEEASVLYFEIVASIDGMESQDSPATLVQLSYLNNLAMAYLKLGRNQVYRYLYERSRWMGPT